MSDQELLKQAESHYEIAAALEDADYEAAEALKSMAASHLVIARNSVEKTVIDGVSMAPPVLSDERDGSQPVDGRPIKKLTVTLVVDGNEHTMSYGTPELLNLMTDQGIVDAFKFSGSQLVKSLRDQQILPKEKS